MPQGGDKDPLNALEESLEGLSHERCVQLWRQLSGGALGRGSKVAAVQRSVAGRLNVKRQDHVRRLFLSVLEPVLQRERAFVDGMQHLPGMIHFVDLGALWLALYDGPLAQRGRDIQAWLTERAREAPIFEVISGADAQACREELRSEAVRVLAESFRKPDQLKALLELVNRYRAQTARQAFGRDVVPPALQQEDLGELHAALAYAADLRSTAEQLEVAPEIPVEPAADSARHAIQALRSDVSEHFARQTPWLIPVLAEIHRHRRVGLAGALLADLPKYDQHRLSSVIAGHHAIAGEVLRRFFDDDLARSDAALSHARLDELETALEIFMAAMAETEAQGFRLEGVRRRRITAMTRHVRDMAARNGTAVLTPRIDTLLKKPKVGDDYYLATRRLITIVRRLGELATGELSPSQIVQRWQHERGKALHRAFIQAAEDLPQRDLPMYLPRIINTGHALGLDTGAWVNVISYGLILSATAYFSGRFRNLGNQSAREAEELALHVLELARAELRERRNAQPEDLRALRQAAETWAQETGREIPSLDEAENGSTVS